MCGSSRERDAEAWLMFLRHWMHFVKTLLLLLLFRGSLSLFSTNKSAAWIAFPFQLPSIIAVISHNSISYCSLALPSLCVTTCPFLAFGHLLDKYLSTLLPFSTICMIFGFILMGLLFYLHTYLVIQSHLQHLINQHAAEKCKDLTHCDFCLISK